MGQRFWLGIGILLSLLAVGVGMWLLSDSICGRASEQFMEAAQAAEQGQLSQAMALAAQAWKLWQNGVFFQSDPQTELQFAKLQALAEQGDGPGVRLQCRLLALRIRDAGAIYGLSWKNLL